MTTPTETAPQTQTPTTEAKGKSNMTNRQNTLTGLLNQKAPTSENVLLEIEGKEVEIVGIEISDERQGRRGKYKLAKIDLSDGRSFNVAGSGVTTPLSYVEPEDLPVFAVFERVESDFEKGTYYWRVR